MIEDVVEPEFWDSALFEEEAGEVVIVTVHPGKGFVNIYGEI